MNKGFGVSGVISEGFDQILDPKRLEDWFENLPETAKEEPTDVLVMVFVVENLGGANNA